jgi:hypothetical protein
VLEERWTALLGGDPRPWLLASEEPAARWVTLTRLLDRPNNDPDVLAARKAVLADPTTRELIARLPDWERPQVVSGHASPAFAPNLLQLLADLGVRGGDDERIERLLDAMLAHQEASGRFPTLAGGRANAEAAWGALLCDAHVILEVLLRFGRGDDARVSAALDRAAADLANAAQGLAWPCLPHPANGFRGPGRKSDFCPMVTLEALRAFARLPEERRPPRLNEVARVSLRAWRARGTEKPYLFGHGRQFKIVKWPAFWYDAYWLLDTLGRYPSLWRGPSADPGDREALAEVVACLVAYNVGPDGRVTPGACYRGFENFSLGQKKRPSPFATARLAVVLRRLDDLADEVRRVDVRALASSKGGTGRAIPPSTGYARNGGRKETPKGE